MITHKELRRIAVHTLFSTQVLFNGKRYDSAMYLCGYVVEMGLKAVVCKQLKLRGIPSTSDEFGAIERLKTHNFERLLDLTGAVVKQDIKANHFNDWSTVGKWSPDQRYTPVDNSLAHKKDADELLKATRHIFGVIKKYID